jgi:peptide/nickel transport system substrate-binding protein
MRRRDLLKAAPLLVTPSLAQGSRRLRFVPQADLASLDPLWQPTPVTVNHAYMVYDTLYGIDLAGEAHPQMCAGHDISGDELTWTFTLRDGLLFHDKEKVLARDCVMSMRRWAVRDPMGQQLMATANDIAVLDDRRFQIRLKRPFHQMLYTLGAQVCFMMPERIARTPATEQIKDAVGSGPFRFLPDEWVSGAHAAYARFDDYQPRPEPADCLTGGKIVHFDRVEWIVQPDPSTSDAALRTGEVDWLAQPLIDLCTALRKTPGIKVEVLSPYGSLTMIRVNHVQPPFDNPALRRALLPGIDQKSFMEAVVGEQAELGHVPTGFFTPGQPMATEAGLEVMAGARGVSLAKKLVAESGYNGETVYLMAPSDLPATMQLAEVTQAYFVSIGLKVDLHTMDFGSMVTRAFNQGPPDKGGWNASNVVMGGLVTANPGSSFPLRCNGRKGWTGW